MARRTDTHTVSNIKPEEYVYCFSYSLPSQLEGWPVPAVNMHLIVELRKSNAKFADHGGTGQCTVCGARFVHGDVWKHLPTGEHIHIGHMCAPKYELIADRREYEKAIGAARVRSAREHEKAIKDERFQEFVDSAGIAEALENEHHIVQDIRAKLYQYGSISKKQIALVEKIHTNSQKPETAEKHVAAPITGTRQKITGEVVSVKVHESMYGSTLKMTVKVSTAAGSWLVWGTVPSTLLGARDSREQELREQLKQGLISQAEYSIPTLRGAVVEFCATLKPGRDPHFAIASRPSKASVVSWPEIL